MGPKEKKTTAEAASLLEEIANLMNLAGENPFKVRAFEKAAGVLMELPASEDLFARARDATLTELTGIGKGIAEVLTEFLLYGKTPARDELSKKLPHGLLDLVQIPGLGPKKAMQLTQELEIHSLSELEYACRENRLLKLKGFGVKAQDKILQGIQFVNSHKGQQRLVDVLPAASAALEKLREAAHGARVEETGELRRKLEVVSALDYIVESPEGSKSLRAKMEAEAAKIQKAVAAPVPLRLHFAKPERFGYEWARSTGSEAHWRALGNPVASDCADEAEFFKKQGLSVPPPETRETGEELELARGQGLDELLPWDGVQGVFHNHTTRSDGTATLEQMIVAAKTLGYKYIGISDHSQSAFYAQGLKVPTLMDQEKEVRALQEKYPEIRIFWGIESDILADGSLDYEAKVLKKFDFVIASIHSRFKMEREAMTDRILEAIRNPYTRFLGHATGRLLLGRPGYALDMEKIIAEAAKRDVAIEINANPARLDIDWRWGGELRKRGTLVSVNPDAHATEGLEDTGFGVTVARKALLPVQQVVNARSAKEVEKWLKRA